MTTGKKDQAAPNFKDALAALLDEHSSLKDKEILDALLAARGIGWQPLVAEAKKRGYRPNIDGDVKPQLDSLLSQKVALEKQLEMLQQPAGQQKTDADAQTDTSSPSPSPDNQHNAASNDISAAIASVLTPIVKTVADLGQNVATLMADREQSQAASLRERVLAQVEKETGKKIAPEIAATIQGDDEATLKANFTQIANLLGQPQALPGAPTSISPPGNQPNIVSPVADDLTKIVEAAASALNDDGQPGIQENFADPSSAATQSGAQ